MKSIISRSCTIALAAAVVLIGAKAYAQQGCETVAAGQFCNLVEINTAAPQEASVGETIVNTICVRALANIGDVEVKAPATPGLEYVKSEPAGTKEGDAIVWKFDAMNCGEVQQINVYYRLTKEGCNVSCAMVEALPRVCFAILGTKPSVEIEKAGPETAILGDQVTYTINVANTGSGVARNVRVVDDLPAGLKHASGQSQLETVLGDLAPGETRCITITVTAAARGKHCNKATVKSDNAGSDDATACTEVLEPGIKITKVTDTKEQYIGKTAGYTITIENTGNMALHNVTIRDAAPANTEMVKADGGAMAGNGATWTFAELPVGGKQTVSMTLTSGVPGTHKNCAQVSAQEGVGGEACAETLWKGNPAILLEVIDTEDPLQIGEETTYVIDVTNQGTADDKNVQIVVNFPAEISPVSAAGASAGAVAEKTVTFEPYAVLAPKQTIEFRIKAKAAQVGDSRLKVQLTSDMLKSPVTEEESTHVY
ncbi:DUF11 domain-containing protein [bacterium]|nr:DUF11 domain-containing protein [bacterium]